MGDPVPWTIAVVSREDEHTSRGRAELVSRALDVGQLRERFREFMAGLQAIVDAGEGGGPFELSEIQFSAEISATGEFRLLGAGVGVDASSAVTFVLRRRGPG